MRVIRSLIYNVAVACSIAFFFSCYDDKSVLATNVIDEVVIDTTGIRLNHYVGYQERLTIAPAITIGGDNNDSGLLYEWSLAIFTSSTSEFEVVSTDKVFDEMINRPISTVPYTLKLTVTDTAHDNLQYPCLWKVYVQSSFLDGLLIADTEDGTHSDFTLIMNNRLTVNYDKEEKIYRRIQENANGVPYNKLMTSLTYEVYSSQINQVWAITDDGGCVRFLTKDYSVNGNFDDESIIVYKPDGLKFKSLFRGYQMFIANTTLGFYSFMIASVNAFGWYDATLMDYLPNNDIVASTSSSAVYDNHTVWLDKTRGQFIFYSGSPSISPSVGSYEANVIFNPNAMTNQTAIAAGILEDGSIATFLLKDNSSGEYAIYTLGQYRQAQGDWDNDWNWIETEPEVPAAARNKYIVPNEGKALLNNAVSVFFAQRESVLYVATDNAIYAILYGSGDNAVVSTVPKYTVSSGEIITKAKLYQQGHHTNDNSTTAGIPPSVTPLAWNNKAIILATQKGNYEGKVCIIPISQPGIGTLDPSGELAYDGFGKILDVITVGN